MSQKSRTGPLVNSRSKLELPSDFDPSHAGEFLQQAVAELGLPDDSVLRVDQFQRDPDGARLDVTGTAPLPLKGRNLGPVSGVVVDSRVRGTLRFDKKGQLLKSGVQTLDNDQTSAITGNIRKLLDSDQIYFAAPAEEIDFSLLQREHKTFYVQEDSQGRKRMRRANIS